MIIRKHKGYRLRMIELVAENRRETELLRELFEGVEGDRYHRHSFGYDRKMPKRGGIEGYVSWAKRQVLTFKRKVRK